MMPAASALPCLLARPAANPGRLTFTPAIRRAPSPPDASIAIAPPPAPGRTAPAARPSAPLPRRQAEPRRTIMAEQPPGLNHQSGPGAPPPPVADAIVRADMLRCDRRLEGG